MFLYQAVWLLWPCPFSRSGLGLNHRRKLRSQTWCRRIARLWFATTPLSSCFFSQAVWLILPCPFSRSGLGLNHRRKLGSQTRFHRIACLWSVTTPLSSCFYLKAFGCYELLYFFPWGAAPPIGFFGAFMTAKLVPLDSPSLVCNNAVEFMFLSQAVWLLWSCPFSKSGLGLNHRRKLGSQTRFHRIACLWSDTTPLSSCFYLKAFGCYELSYFFHWGTASPIGFFGAFMMAKLVPQDSPPLAWYNHSEYVYLSQSVWPSIACSWWLWGSTPQIGFWGAVRGEMVPPDSPPLVC